MMYLIFAALAVLACLGVFCLYRVAQDRRKQGRVGLLGAFLIWGIYLIYTALTALMAFRGLWPMPLSDLPTSVAGAIALIGGVVLVAGGLTAFGSIESASGCDHSSLVQTGIYRYTRNPQNVGWGMALVGVALLGQSWMALLLAIVFLALFRIYVPFEERHMENVYGAEWRRYARLSPRFLDLSALRGTRHARSRTGTTSERPGRPGQSADLV